jgi:hypothetical protein
MKIMAFKAVDRDPLRGWATVLMPSGMILHDVGVFHDRGSDRSWVSAPSKPMIGRDGVQLRATTNAKLLYTPVITFETATIYRKFSDSVIAALRLAYPQALPLETEGQSK